VQQAIAEEMERLVRMSVDQLRARYREVYGEEASSGHRQHLVRRIGWRLQVLAQGDLTERAAAGAGDRPGCGFEDAGAARLGAWYRRRSVIDLRMSPERTREPTLPARRRCNLRL